MLSHRRVEIDRRYSNLTRFCKENSIDYRLAWDLEKGARENYRPVTLAGVELAYRLEAGSIRDALAGGDFRPADLTAREMAILKAAPEAVRILLEQQHRGSNAV